MIRFLPAGWSWFRGRDPLCRNCWKARIEFVLSDDERDKLIGQFVFLDSAMRAGSQRKRRPAMMHEAGERTEV
jgi:hypothetical protein